jgi:hypothetical protein
MQQHYHSAAKVVIVAAKCLLTRMNPDTAIRSTGKVKDKNFYPQASMALRRIRQSPGGDDWLLGADQPRTGKGATLEGYGGTRPTMGDAGAQRQPPSA